MSWADPLVLVPAGLLALLVLARLARLRPGLRPLVGPFALFVVVLSGLTLFAGGPLPASPWLSLLFLIPLLTLVVRGNVIAFQWLFQRRHGAEPPSLLDSVISVAFYAVGLGAVAHYWFKLELTPFLATSAVVGAVVGLALQDTLGNLFSGLALQMGRPFDVGDWVEVDAIPANAGRVVEVGWRQTKIITLDAVEVIIPNGMLTCRPLNAAISFSVSADFAFFMPAARDWMAL